MKSREEYADYLRREIEGCRVRRQALLAEVELSETHRRLRAKMGVDEARHAELPSLAALNRAEAFRLNASAEETFRELLAKHLARRGDGTVEPIRARSDDAALFELLASVGCRPAAAARVVENTGDHTVAD